MRTIRLSLSEACGPNQAQDRLNKALGKIGLSDHQELVDQVLVVLNDLDRRGHELMACGSQFQFERLIEFPTLRVNISASYGALHRRISLTWIRSHLGRA